MSAPRLVHVGIAATDVERSVRFWRDALGLRVTGAFGNAYDLTDGYHNVRLFQYTGPARSDHVSGLATYLHVGVKVDDLTSAVERCTGLGFAIVCDDIDNPKPFDPSAPPAASFKVEDPDGIVVDVTASNDQWPDMPTR